MAAHVVGRVLMIAFHYPPAGGGSGVHRTLRFAGDLPAHGWQPHVLTVRTAAYPEIDRSAEHDVPADVPVTRTFAFDAGRHLAVRGRFAGFTAWPDRWSSWWFSAVARGLTIIRRERPDVIWSTYPLPTAHLIGLTLARLTGRPWVADCRDSLSDAVYPRDASRRRLHQWLERRMFERAAHVVFSTEGTIELYRARYPQYRQCAVSCIPNGYSEADFQGLDASAPVARPAHAPLTLLHCGVLYPVERDPTQFFHALGDLRDSGEISADRVRIVLRGTRHDSEYAPLLARHRLEGLVELRPWIEHREALREMMAADGLLLFQAANCNHQIPAKLYEYLRTGKPVLALTDARGDTARLMTEQGLGSICDLGDRESIKRGLMGFLAGIATLETPVRAAQELGAFTRSSQARRLADVLQAARTSA